jgi:hypothetical protein
LPSMYKTLGFIPNTASKECISVKFCLQKFWMAGQAKTKERTIKKKKATWFW